jgi:hypothetical protein
MCWNKEVSWTTFSIGTAFNLINSIIIPKPQIIAVSLVWQWVLLMQLFDALLWMDQECGTLNKYATLGAFAANMLQPVVVFMALIFIAPSNMVLKLTALVLVMGYLSYTYAAAAHMPRLECTKPKDGCKHLRYTWWNHIEGWPYVVCLLTVMVLLFRPLTFCLLEVGYIVITLIISAFIYKKSGTIANMWCFFAAFAPVLTIPFWKISERFPLEPYLKQK